MAKVGKSLTREKSASLEPGVKAPGFFIEK